MVITVVYDTCVLFGNSQRDLLLRVGIAGLVRARYSATILGELERALVEDRGIEPTKAARLRSLIERAIPDGLVEGYEEIAATLELPDAADRHVLAAAICARASLVVTENRKHFPSKVLDKYGIETRSADDFLQDLICLYPDIVRFCAHQIAASRTNPPTVFGEVVTQLERSGLIGTAAALALGR